MTPVFSRMLVLAMEAGGEPTAPARPAQSSPFSGMFGLLPIILIMVAFFWFTARSQKKRDRQRQQMLDSIKAKDDVVTVGGIRGRVVQVKDDEVVLRVDPDKDVKITFAKSGIHRKLGDEKPE